MPRRATTRLAQPGRAHCGHVTQRCQERRFLLRCKDDRRQYLKRMREAVAVGSRDWIESLGERLLHRWRDISAVVALEAGIAESAATYVVRVGNRVREGLLAVMDR